MSCVTSNEIGAAVNHLQELLGYELEMTLGQIKDETRPGGNFDWVKHCVEKAQVLERHVAALKELEEDAMDILFNTLSYSSDGVDVAGGGLRTLTVEVSQGMLNQHLLTLTDARRQGVVRIGEKFKITLPGGTTFETELCDPGNKLRERGLIRRFYEEAKIADGDKVILTEITAGTWQLMSAKSAEGKQIIATLHARSFAALEGLAANLPREPSKEASK